MLAIGRTQALRAGLAAALIALAAFVGSAGAAERAGPDAASTYALDVAGLACPFCAYGIEKRLRKLGGADGVEVDIAGGRVLVTMQAGASLTREQAAAAVDEAGFTLRGFEEVAPGADDHAQG